MKRLLCVLSGLALFTSTWVAAQSKVPPTTPEKSPPPQKGPSKPPTTPEKSPPPQKGPSKPPTTPEKSPPPQKGPSKPPTTPEKSPPPQKGPSKPPTTPEKSPPPQKGPSKPPTTPEKSPPPQKGPSKPPTTPEKSPPPQKGPSNPPTTPEKSPPPQKGPSNPPTTPEKSPPPQKGPSNPPPSTPRGTGPSKGPSGDDYLRKGNDYLRKGDDYLRGPGAPSEFRPEERRRDDGPAYQPRTGGFKPLPTKAPQPTQPLNLGRPSDGRSPGLASLPKPVVSSSSNRGSLPYLVQRSEAYRVGLRVGYYHYDPYWQPWHYGYGYYVYYPVPGDCYFSPYYYYWTCPPYIYSRRVIIVTPRVVVIFGDPLRWVYCGYGSRYNYGYGGGYHYSNYSIVDETVSRLVDAFRYSDVSSLDALVPRNTTVDIYVDGDYAYSLSSDDYYDITADMIESVYTRNFVVEKVQKTRDGGLWVVARHEFVDAWNAQQRTWLTFYLERRGDRYVITQAGTYSYRP